MVTSSRGLGCTKIKQPPYQRHWIQRSVMTTRIMMISPRKTSTSWGIPRMVYTVTSPMMPVGKFSKKLQSRMKFPWSDSSRSAPHCRFPLTLDLSTGVILMAAFTIQSSIPPINGRPDWYLVFPRLRNQIQCTTRWKTHTRCQRSQRYWQRLPTSLKIRHNRSWVRNVLIVLQDFLGKYGKSSLKIYPLATHWAYECHPGLFFPSWTAQPFGHLDSQAGLHQTVAFFLRNERVQRPEIGMPSIGLPIAPEAHLDLETDRESGALSIILLICWICPQSATRTWQKSMTR